MSNFEDGYMDCIGWCECNSDNPELEFASWSGEAIDQAERDCVDFQADNAALLAQAYDCDYSEARAGHDFWLTRNGHGCGFWCRDELGDELGQALTVAAHKFGPCDVYAGDNGWLYLC